MPIDRRITNGLAWAGALLVVAIPVADFATSQFGSRMPQVAVVDPEVTKDTEDGEEGAQTTLPTPVSQRPEPVAVAETPAPEPVAPTQPVRKPEPVAPAQPVREPDPVTTAAVGNRPSSNNAVDDFLNAGRPMPSYITGAGGATPAPTASVEQPATAKPQPTQPAVSPPAGASKPGAASGTEQVAAVPARVPGFPTPVAQRPASLPRSQGAIQPPLVIGDDPTLISAEDLEDWESGPLSEFLARRQAGGEPVPPDYDQDGFFLDQGPNSGVTVQRFPNAYDPYFYPFE